MPDEIAVSEKKKRRKKQRKPRCTVVRDVLLICQSRLVPRTEATGVRGLQAFFVYARPTNKGTTPPALALVKMRSDLTTSGGGRTGGRGAELCGRVCVMCDVLLYVLRSVAAEQDGPSRAGKKKKGEIGKKVKIAC